MQYDYGIVMAIIVMGVSISEKIWTGRIQRKLCAADRKLTLYIACKELLK